MKAKEVIEKRLEEIERSARELLEWAQAHPEASLRELEEKVQAWKQGAGVRVLEGAVALRGEGDLQEERCACGGKWVFQGYREREVMTSQGAGVGAPAGGMGARGGVVGQAPPGARRSPAPDVGGCSPSRGTGDWRAM